MAWYKAAFSVAQGYNTRIGCQFQAEHGALIESFQWRPDLLNTRVISLISVEAGG